LTHIFAEPHGVFDDGCNAAIWEPIKDWRESYMAALLEPDPQRQREMIEDALVAIEQTPNTLVKQKADDAIAMLNALRKKVK
jgi:hypothetical protein